MVAWALKEWDVAVTALLQGQTWLLLRKGGIREYQGRFDVAARQVLLLPTFEHQDPALLKPAYQPLVSSELGSENPDAPGQQAIFRGWAEITHVFSVTSEAAALDLVPALIWNRQFVQTRWQWQPDRPFYGLVLRAYRFEVPLSLPWHSGYRGCRSWVELGESVAVEGSSPVLPEAEFHHHVSHLLANLPEESRLLQP